ncbi:MAG: cytochrome c oxidase subunit 3 [Phycisphaeraceae bacterium]|nr:cytochrome c oxidase subunit 3 [Phycisphaeraceae bacterium]
MKLLTHGNPKDHQTVATACQPYPLGRRTLGSESPAANDLATARLGMWLFLATEALMFGGLFCLYAVFHAKFPAAFEWGRAQLDIGWGLINTVILLLSSFTMAMALYSAQTGRRSAVSLFLTLTVMCGVMFLGVKTIEYQHKFHEGLLWAGAFSADSAETGTANETKPIEPAAALSPALARGKRVFEMSCAVCHGSQGQGVTGSGLPLAGSAFLDDRSDAELVDFIKTGRSAGDPQNRTGMAMPPSGGNPSLSDRDLGLIAGYLRSLEPPAEPTYVLPNPSEFRVPRSVIAVATEGPTGVADWVLAGLNQPPKPTPVRESKPTTPLPPPAGAEQFFSIYFTMTGLHALHLVVGIGVMLWLLGRSWRRPFHRGDCTPLEIGGLYWHLVDVIWILLFPLLYLVH